MLFRFRQRGRDVKDESMSSALWRIFISYYGLCATAGEFMARGTAMFVEYTRVFTQLASILDIGFEPMTCRGLPYLFLFVAKAAAPYVFIMLVAAGVPCYITCRRRFERRAARRGRRNSLELGLTPSALGIGAEAQAEQFSLTSHIVGSLVFVMYYLFPSTVIGLFKTFHCTPSFFGKRYLLSDLQIECYSGVHMLSAWIAGALLIFYIIAVPGAIVWITKRNHSKLHSKRYEMMYGPS